MEDTNHTQEPGQQQQPPSTFIAADANNTTAASILPASLEHSLSPEGHQTPLNLVGQLSSIPHHEALLLDQVVSGAQASTTTAAAANTFHPTPTSSADILTNGTSIAAAVGMPVTSMDSSTAASLLHSTLGQGLGLPPVTPGDTPSDIVKGLLGHTASAFALPGTTAGQTGAGIDVAAAAASVGSNYTKVVNVPWQEILADMIAESRRMMAVEELVLSKASLNRAPQVFAKYLPKLLPMASQIQDLPPLHEPMKRTADDDDVDMTDATGADQDSTAKRRKYADEVGVNTVLNHASRQEITALVDEFIATKREQINESNRNEFIKKSSTRPKSDGDKAEGGAKGDGGDGDEDNDDDDGCARVDARKLNRTIQMRQEVVKNEALTKTNPKGHSMDNNASQLGSNALDERLNNIQEHLNVRLAANPPCTLTERVKILEDMIMQLERDYPPWAALHFNQPNRIFPPPPSMTTVTRGYMNQLLMTGDHLLSPSTMTGDILMPLGMDVHAAPANMARTPSSGLDARSLMSSTLTPSGGGGNGGGGGSRGSSFSGPSAAISGAIGVSSSSSTAGFPGSVAATTTVSHQHHHHQQQHHHHHNNQPSMSSSSSSTSSAGGVGGSGATTSGSATVIKLKRHGGGSSSLQRAVQEQLAQRQAMAAKGLTAPKPFVHPLNDPTVRPTTPTPTSATGGAATTATSSTGGSSSGSGVAKGASNNGNNNNSHAVSPMMPPFEDLSKPGVTGRGPIKSRRKSIAKGLDPASAMAAMGVVGSPVLSAVNSSGGVTSTSGAGTGGSGAAGARTGGGGGGGDGTGAASKKPRKKRTSVSGPSTENHGHNGPTKAAAAAAAAKPPRLGLGKGKMGGGGAMSAAAGRGLGKGKMGGGLGKGKGGAYLQKHYNQVSEDDEEEEDEEEEDEEADFVKASSTSRASKATTGRSSGSAKAKKAKGRAAAVPVRKFGGKSFGMVGGESSGSSSNESSDEDGDGSGSSGSQSDSSSSSSLGSGSDLGDSD
ncbi:hypothetical protein DFQ27_001864 [Actinomortierella ambigua]|uniref:Uncharacterized protein n=1 Tax=Actinomortierella ambigua TaxID=1343610 RepID=A0A9P6Q9Y0_9FUNG|nr:hypothetical protein DFQ27_001864 [Actinomortierella ambigua]